MTQQPILGGPLAVIPPCARLAAVCAALDGRTLTCPAAARRTCATLALLRRIGAAPEESAAH